MVNKNFIKILIMVTPLLGFCAHEHEFIPVKSSRSFLTRFCDGISCTNSNAVRQDVYKIEPQNFAGQKIHIEHKEVSDSIDITGLDLHVPIIHDDASTAILSTDRSLQLQDLQPIDHQVTKKSLPVRSTWQNIKEIFFKPQDINVPNKKGIYPLEQAIIDGNVGQVIQFVQAGADVNIVNKKGESLLHQVIQFASGYQDDHMSAAILEFLIEHGATVDVQNRAGQTPLHCAVLLLSSEMVDILVAHKANLNLQDNQGQTPLMALIHRGMPPVGVQSLVREQQASMIKDLIRSGADITIKDYNNRLPIDDVNYQIKEHGMVSDVANYFNDRYAVLNKKQGLKS